MPSVLLVRHAQASFGGADYDVLSPHGQRQVDALAIEIARRGVRLDRIVTGTHSRQRDTAAPIASVSGQTIMVDERFNEYDSGDVLCHHSSSAARLQRRDDSGSPAVSSREFQTHLDRALHGWIAAGAGGPSAEPWARFLARASSALIDLVTDLGSGETALVCTSGGVVGAICVAVLELPAPAFVAFNRVSVNAGISTVAHGRSGTSLISFNEHGYLERDGHSLLSYR